MGQGVEKRNQSIFCFISVHRKVILDKRGEGSEREVETE